MKIHTQTEGDCSDTRELGQYVRGNQQKTLKLVPSYRGVLEKTPFFRPRRLVTLLSLFFCLPPELTARHSPRKKKKKKCHVQLQEHTAEDVTRKEVYSERYVDLLRKPLLPSDETEKKEETCLGTGLENS